MKGEVDLHQVAPFVSETEVKGHSGLVDVDAFARVVVCPERRFRLRLQWNDLVDVPAAVR